MPNVLDVLKDRGFIKQITFEDDLYKLLDEEQVTFYVGFDPTADSLHVGHYIPVMAMAHMQRAGHKPIALVGGGTAMIGDPSFKSDMRTMMTREKVAANAEALKRQLSRFMDFSEGKAIMADNADWLLKLNYVEFIRDIGALFSVNRMLAAECYKQRLEKGLSFLEFNYMLMQGYDFLVLNQKYGCKLQMGGDDQWSNMLAGADLIRRKERKDAYACTFSLLTNSEGVKMGKTVSGALWLDAEKTSPYDFYQYWRNVEDNDVQKCLAMLTFLPMDEVRRLGALEGSKINQAKVVLAYEVTKLVHGEQAAAEAKAAAEALFSGGVDDKSIPTLTITREQFDSNRRVVDLMLLAGLTKSLGDGRRQIQQNAVSLNDEKVTEPDQAVTMQDFKDGSLILRKGKKAYYRVSIE